MKLTDMNFETHDACEALTSAMLSIPVRERRAHERTFSPGEIIWRPSALPDCVYLLTAGRVEVFALDRHGRVSVLEQVAPGQVFGYLCFCSHRSEPMATEARATVVSRVVQTAAKDFDRALQRDRRVAGLLTTTLCMRNAQANARMILLSTHNARLRILTLLLQLAERKAQQLPQWPRQVSVHLSHAEMAAHACLTRTHVTTLMTRLRDDGVVSYKRGSAIRVHIKRIEAAMEAAEEETVRARSV